MIELCDIGWIIPDGLDVSNFDFSWRPSPYEPPYIHQFGTQHQKTGGPRWVVSGATQIKYVDTQHAVALPGSNWTIPDNIDITGFDLSWHPDSTEEPFIYQFGTQHQRTGGPKFVVPGATQVKFVDSQRAIALPHSNWTIPEEITNLSAEIVDFDWSWHPDDTEEPYIYAWGNQWRSAEETPTLLYSTAGAHRYKYMHNTIATLAMPKLDAVYVSNGESGEEARYSRLLHHAGRWGNKVNWIRGVNGREVALYEAALSCTTDWFWCIPAKLWVDDSFDLGWHPNPWVEPTHWITHAINPLNGLIYGHQAAVCYYRQHIINTYRGGSWGLDFTMSAPHNIHPVISGVAQYNSDPWTTWRTAFREVIKLKAAADRGDTHSANRLKIWLEIANGPHSDWSILGGKDAIEYYVSVNGNPELLQHTFYWSWLSEYANGRGYKFTGDK